MNQDLSPNEVSAPENPESICVNVLLKFSGTSTIKLAMYVVQVSLAMVQKWYLA